MANVQGRRKPDPRQTAQQATCARHEITYYFVRAPSCPLCDAQTTIADLEAISRKLLNENQMLQDQIHELNLVVDLVSAIRDASETLDDADEEFLKLTLYRLRDQGDVVLRVTHHVQGKGKRRSTTANGFMVIPRKGDPYAHLCTSPGGIAIAEYYEEAYNAIGQVKAMTYLTRGLSKLLPGGLS